MFISFEGTEGVGKSTLIASLQQHFKQHHEVVLTREPGGTPLAEKIRTLLLQPEQEQMSHETELLLIYAARAQHLQQIILPALQQQKLVLCDRFVDASIAYQHGGREMDLAQIEVLTQHFVKRLPDLTIWLDAPVELGMHRAQNRGHLDRFEQEKLDFFTKVRACYQRLAKKEPERIVRLDASLTAAQLSQQAISLISEKLANHS